MNFTFGRCTECGRNVKIDVNAILCDVKCDCEKTVAEVPKKKAVKKVERDATKTI